MDIDVDIRTLPGETRDDVDAHLRAALGELAARVDVSRLQESTPTRSATGNPLWDVLTARSQVAYPGAELLAGIMVGGTDARFYRERGAIAYGAALFSPDMTLESFGQRFHGNDERIDVDSLGLVHRVLVRHRQGPRRLTRRMTSLPADGAISHDSFERGHAISRCRLGSQFIRESGRPHRFRRLFIMRSSA